MSNLSCTVQAIPVAPGIAIGKVMRLQSSAHTPERKLIAPDAVDAEIARFNAAVSTSRKQLQELCNKMHSRLSGEEANIFDAHLLLLDDHTMCGEVMHNIADEHFEAGFAVYSAVEKYAAVFSQLADAYFKERAMDIRDVGMRIISNLQNASEKINYDEQRIVIASVLTPSETVSLDREKVLGFAVETGSATSHAAILARSFKIPAVVGVPKDLLEKLTISDTLIVDGFTGKVLVNPDPRTTEAYQLRRAEKQNFYRQLVEEKDLPPDTRDGYRIDLAVNLNGGQDFSEVIQGGGSGVGLYRTEYLYMDSDHLPTEDEQFEVYKHLLVSAENHPVTIRTIDVGGDKFDARISRSNEQNPFLGLRGIRLCLRERRDIFDTQLRALLRAGVYGNLQVMLPMVSSTTELVETKIIINNLQEQLKKENIPCVSRLRLGIMIETPAAALIADQYAGNVDFFSIGTNDLIQYTMAVDRSNERVANLYRPAHPAILHLIKMSVDAAHRANIPVSVCGQMAESISLTPLLVGLGVDELSMPSASLHTQRRIIRSLSRYECESLVSKALKCANASEVTELTGEMIGRCAPEMKELE